MLVNTLSGTLTHVLCRYSSIILIIANMIGYFYNHFSPTVCSRYIYVGTIFKGMIPLPYTVQAPESDRNTQSSRSWSRKQLWLSGGSWPPRSTPQSPTMSCRTYNIAQRNVQIRRTLLVTYIVVTAVCYYHSIR
jgi:hypothetical protein